MSDDLRFVVFDTETTEVGPNKAAVDIAGIEIDPDTFENMGEFESLIDPSKPISPGAQEIHGITAEMVWDAPTIVEFVSEILGGRLEGKIVLIGHRIAFDAPLFAPIGDVDRTFDTLPLAQRLLPDAPNHKLDTLKELLGLPGGGTSHRAMADTVTCLQLLQYLVTLSGRTLRQHCSGELQIIHRMPWGKNSGKLLADVPASYRRWMLSEAKDLDPNLKHSLKLLQKAGL